MTNNTSGTPPFAKRTPWAWSIGTFFGAGLLKPGPGTWGSLAAALCWYAAAVSLRSPSHGPSAWALTAGTAVAALLVIVVGIPAGTIVARESGREDPGHVVIDEVAGQLITLLGCRPDWKHALLALGLFRLFDITKPWPARKLEDLPGGWGIMLDDLAAGVYGLAVLLLVEHWW